MTRCDLAAGDTLERFLRGELPREEARGLVRHLLTRCPACLPTTRRLWGSETGRRGRTG
jgi:anti-sigma factor RsiW